jgi:hypothetical protein
VHIVPTPHADVASRPDAEGHDTRVVLLPSFRETGTVVLVHTSTLEVRCVQLDLQL